MLTLTKHCLECFSNLKNVSKQTIHRLKNIDAWLNYDVKLFSEEGC